MKILDKNTFNDFINNDEHVVVDYFSKSCAPCMAFIDSFEGLSQKYEKIEFGKLDTKENRRLAIKQRVMGLPTIIIYKNGKKISELTKEEVTLVKLDSLLESL